jgi:hypothetical protein
MKSTAFTLHWTFRNDHAWQWSSTSLDEVFDYMYKTQVCTHPDVIYVAIKRDGEMYQQYKGEQQ